LYNNIKVNIDIRPDTTIIYNSKYYKINSTWLHVSAAHASIFRPALDRTSTLMSAQ